jgi:DNA-binding MurR/RpiR family transcriptional regulator
MGYMSVARQQDWLPDALVARLAAALGSLPPAQRQVAEYLLQAGPAIVVRSASEIAEQLGVSDATVIRTAQALGFGGLPELRRALAGGDDQPSLGDRLQRTLRQAGDSGDVLATSVESLLASLGVLVEQVSPDLFGRAVRLLAGAEPVLWSGIGPSAALADYACTLTRRVGWESVALTQAGIGAADDLLLLRPGSALVVLAYGQVHAHVRTLLGQAARSNLPVVLITDTLQHELGPLVSETLTCWRGNPGFFSSHAPTVVLLDALVLGVANTDPARAQRSLAELTTWRALVS